MSKAMTIRLATEDEVTALWRLMRDGYPGQILQGTICESPLFPRYLAARFRSNDLFIVAAVADGPGAPLGFTHVVQGGASLHVNHMIVSAAARGQGIGGRLLSDVLARARAESLGVTLDVDSRNPEAIRFYERAGFVTETETPVAMIPHRSGNLPPTLVAGSRDYREHGFCYVLQRWGEDAFRMGVVAPRTLRLFAALMPAGFDWPGFVAWARWANIYVYGNAPHGLDPGIEERWEILRMRSGYEDDNA